MSPRSSHAGLRKRKIGLLAVLVVLAVLSVAVGFSNAMYSSYQVQKAQIIKNALAANHARAEKLAEVIDVYIAALHRQARNAAGQLAASMGKPQALQNELQRLAGQVDSLHAVMLADAEGRIVARSPTGQLADAKILRLADLGVSAPGSGAWVTEIPGAQAAVLTVAEPVEDAAGAPQAYLAITITLDAGSGMDRIIGDRDEIAGMSVFLVGSNGDVLYRRHAAPDTLDLASIESARNVGAALHPKADGGAVLTGYAPLPKGNWAVVAQRTLDQVLSPLRELLGDALRSAIPAIALTLLLVCGLAYAIASPLSRLTRAMTAGKSGGVDLARLNAWYAEADTLREAVRSTLDQHQDEVGRLNTQALTDPMTGLLNRRAMTEVLNAYAADGASVAVIAMDLDHFKRINDSFGHMTGDKVLIALTEVIRAGLRDQDRAFRVGGEEFIALLPTGSAEKACEVAERLRTAVARRLMPDSVGRVTISIGVALWPQDGESASEVIRRADEALYASKQAGRNRVTLWRDQAQAVPPYPTNRN
ncbi:sensor domain-containing diguanylate cyclase [Achromobacter aegrifaciens]|uniref:GGDEF domain-containing protein n=1 Tax=Achromobacter aegrifaciens TaxID=1287736 RepID=UPI0027B985A0|nr:sensor domain-containing diguanylate cyclase [Achromobacter aegrifaciens]WLW64474.1 sensor domain-containing diguanylate cyclase [Achromobacter aegrifaciens]